MSLGGKTKLGRSPDNPGGDTDPKKASEGAPENGRAGKVSRAATGPGTGPPDAESVEEAPHEEDDPLIGKVVGGNFRIKKLLGLGAMGKVYLAEQLSLSKDVAIKVLHKHLAGDEQLARRFHREAKSASLLDHPNSIAIIDFGQDIDGSLYIAMEFLQGTDLAEILEERFPLPLSRIVKILGQVCLALDEAHHQKIVHRDLKPENVMVMNKRGEEDFVKVCDFGIAKVQDPKGDNPESAITMAGIVCGTPEYMSPEQARGETLDGRSDVYALGVMLYQLITGELPFTGETALGIVTKHLTDLPVPPRQKRPDLDIHAALEAFILRTMSKERERRPSSALAFKVEFERVLEVVEGRIPYVDGEFGEGMMPTAEVKLPPKRRGKTVAIVAVAVVAVVAVAAALILRFTGKQKTGAASDKKEPAAAAVAKTDAAVAAGRDAGHVAAVGADASAPQRAVTTSVDASVPRATTGRRRRRRRRRTTPRPPDPMGTRPRPDRPRPPDGPKKPTFKDVYAEAKALFNSGRYSAAVAKFRKASRMKGARAGVHKYIGKCYMRLNRYGSAIRAYKRYVKRAPGAGDAWMYRRIIQKYEASRSMSGSMAR